MGFYCTNINQYNLIKAWSKFYIW